MGSGFFAYPTGAFRNTGLWDRKMNGLKLTLSKADGWESLKQSIQTLHPSELIKKRMQEKQSHGRIKLSCHNVSTQLWVTFASSLQMLMGL